MIFPRETYKREVLGIRFFNEGIEVHLSIGKRKFFRSNFLEEKKYHHLKKDIIDKGGEVFYQREKTYDEIIWYYDKDYIEAPSLVQNDLESLAKTIINKLNNKIKNNQ